MEIEGRKSKEAGIGSGGGGGKLVWLCISVSSTTQCLKRIFSTRLASPLKYERKHTAPHSVCKCQLLFFSYLLTRSRGVSRRPHQVFVCKLRHSI